MQDAVHDLPGDDEPVPMTTTERSVWAYLVAVVLTSGAYLLYLGAQLARTPAHEIEWVVPMLWTLGASVVGSILLTIVGTIVATVIATIGRAAAGRTEHHAPVVESGTDARDDEIGLRAHRAHIGVLAAGFVGALVLAMLDADTFWIGNLLFVVGTAGALVETTTKLRLYRRGF